MLLLSLVLWQYYKYLDVSCKYNSVLCYIYIYIYTVYIYIYIYIHTHILYMQHAKHIKNHGSTIVLFCKSGSMVMLYLKYHSNHLKQSTMILPSFLKYNFRSIISVPWCYHGTHPKNMVVPWYLVNTIVIIQYYNIYIKLPWCYHVFCTCNMVLSWYFTKYL